VRLGDAGDVCGLTDSSDSAWYHTLSRTGASEGFEDDGLVGPFSTSTTLTISPASADNHRIVVVG